MILDEKNPKLIDHAWDFNWATTIIPHNFELEYNKIDDENTVARRPTLYY